MLSSNLRNDCRKFAPNIFNKSKCTNCFRQKEEHSAEALESNRVSRKVTKCGYLFVAPGWDFSDPLNRTKRWQRRWFVLYDDGELNYSVDEHPDTVPQAVIDMNQVLEVTGAEDVTGHTYSLAITAPDRVHFVKASCREEARWWTDVLTVFTRSKGRHKRNATFPGGQSTTILPAATIRSGTPNPIRPRYNSCHSEPCNSLPISQKNNSSSNNINMNKNWDDSNNANTKPNNIQINATEAEEIQKDAVPTHDRNLSSSLTLATSNDIISSNYTPKTSSPTLIETQQTVYKDQPPSSASPPTRDKINTEEKARYRQRKTIQQENTNNNSDNKQCIQKLPSMENTTCNLIDNSCTTPNSSTAAISQNKNEFTHRILLDDYEQQSKRDEKLKDIAAVLTQPRVRRSTQSPLPSNNNGVDDSLQRPTRDITISAERLTKLDSQVTNDSDTVDSVTDKMFCNSRDAYGGFVDLTTHNRYSPSTELRVDLPAEDLLYMKKGWLCKQSYDQHWNRHWFVLKGAALTYYRDPNAEDRGIMDGVIDLNGVTNIIELTVTRNFGFQLTLWDESRILLTAVTSGIRSNWISVLRRAAGLHENSNLTLLRPAEKDVIVPSVPLTTRSVFSSDEEYRTASEGGRCGSNEWCEPLPPSPPLNRTPISRVKERARSRSSSGSRICKRSRSSPPSSRRSTIDSIHTDDLMTFCEFSNDPNHSTLVELLESEVRELRDRLENTQNSSTENNLINKIEQQATEIDNLKSKLSNALDEITNTEKEVNRLKKLKQDAILREKRMEELLSTLENTERQLNEQVEDMELLKQMYGQDKDLWERKLTDNELLLREAANRCELLSKEVNAGRHTIEQLQIELAKLGDRLSRGIDENDILYKRIRELEGRNLSLQSCHEKGRSIDSLSSLTNIDLDLDLDKFDKNHIIDEYNNLKSRFEKAILEIRAMKRELRESYVMYDELELFNIKLKQSMKLQEDNSAAQLNLMAERIQDLTTKLSASEKQVRTLKQKLQDSREKRRSLSLKGRESFSIGKEVEEKLSELELKINALESGKLVKPHLRALAKQRVTKREGSIDRQSPTEERKLRRLQNRPRRKSLDSATSSEPIKILIRLNSLESKVSTISDIQTPLDKTCDASSESINQLDCSISDNDSSSTLPSERLQILENIIISAKDKVNECLCQMSLLKTSKTKRSLSPLTDRRNNEGYRSVEKCLTELAALLKEKSLNNSPNDSTSSIAEINVISDSVKTVVKSLETALRTKLTEIANKRMELRYSGQFTEKVNMQLLAEKLAYESVIIERIYDALNSTTNISRDSTEKIFYNHILKSELLETSHLIANLKRKISGKCLKRAYSSKLSLDYLTKVLANKLIKSGHILSQNINNKTAQNQTTPKIDITDNKMLEFLISKRDEINIALNKYKSTKMEQLANTLAVETLCYVTERNQSASANKTLDERRIRDAWQMAQETVNNELIQSEISHVMMRCAQIYENQLASEHETFFSFYATERTHLENWIQDVEIRLRSEMDENVKELTKFYENSLIKLKQGRQQWRHNVEQERNMYESRKLLAEFADITAHKALIDSRISILSRDYKSNDNSIIKPVFNEDESVIESLMDDENYVTKLSDIDLHLKSSTVLEAEFQYLFQHYIKECSNILDKDKLSSNIQDIIENLNAIEQDICKLECHLKPDQSKGLLEVHSDPTDWKNMHEKCSKLNLRLANITSYILQKPSLCENCEKLQNTMHRLTSDHEEKVRVLQRHQEQSLMELRDALENERASQAQLRERARKLEKRLGTLDSEYSQQVESLRAAYNKTLTTAGLDRSLQGEENVRQRYQAEIEQLRALCEKGLVAMENSHRRVIAELEDKHRREREQLQMEKEAALAEETQATLAALDAMRKAHEAEVQREVAKFKADFIKKMQANPSLNDFGSYKENEEEMEEIKQEILSLSEKYSVKCVESAALEEELARVTSQLAQAQQHIMQLDARNKQLRAHLISEVTDTDSNAFSCTRDLQQTHMSGIKNDVAVGVVVSTQTGSSNSRNINQRLTWKQISSARAGGTTNTASDSACGGSISSMQERFIDTSSNTIVAKPTLSITKLTPSAIKQNYPVSVIYHQTISSCPLAGMVAERKKRFELC